MRVFKLLITVSVPEIWFSCIYFAIANWLVVPFITDCLLVFNTLIFEIYISLDVFAVVFLLKQKFLL